MVAWISIPVGVVYKKSVRVEWFFNRNESYRGIERMGRIAKYVVLLVFVFSWSWACSPQLSNEPTGEVTGEVPATTDAGDAGGGIADAPPNKTCVSARDCPGQACRDGKCVKAFECIGHGDCKKDEYCFEDETGERCVPRCEIDTDCPSGHVCSDGQCHKPNWVKGKLPNEGSTQTQPIKVGVGVVDMDFPLGVSMGGFGFRPGPRGGYAKSLGGSEGAYDRFTIKALMLDDGMERVVLLRSPLIFTTDYMLTQISQRIVKETGIDLISKTLMVSHHSHSAPARFWNLLSDLGFGAFGGGDFLEEVFDRLAESFAKAIVLANNNLAEGRVGYTLVPDFDKENLIFSDRRNQSANNKNPNLLVMRVDKADGTPIAALVTFPMHGTISENTMLTNDAPGGLEFGLEDRLEAKFKTRVDVFFMQGSAGDVSPRGDRMGHKGTLQMQMIGHLASQTIVPLFEKIQTKTDLTLDVANKRIPVSRNSIGYKPGEFYRVILDEQQDHRYGAFQCVGKEYRHDTPEVHKDGKLGCAFSVFDLNGAPIAQFSKTRLTAMRIGDLHISSFPGEVTSILASRFVDAVKQESGSKIKDHVVMGYAQDHHLYILTEDDWYKGGYEASMNVWGPKFGSYLVKEAKALALQLTTPEKEKNDTGILPQDFYGIDLKKIEIPRLKSPKAGTVMTQPPKEYKRMDKRLTFTIYGGFNGTDNPRATLQMKQQDGSFKDVMLNGVRPYDDSGFRMIMTFKAVKEDFMYTFYFEELENFPTGTYRFRVDGTQWDGSKRVAYKVETDAFEIVPSDQLRVWNVTFDGENVEGWISYPSATNDDGKSAFRLEPSGFRLRSPLVTWRVGPPLRENDKVELTITFSQGGNEVAKVTATELNQRKVVKQEVVENRKDDGAETKKTYDALASGFKLKTDSKLAAGEYDVTITIKDSFGNTGSWTKKMTVK
ncbi:MAG: hypothetical protein EP343_22765 [Deltaproteobacteria bacterium]|nr:MAG: hypothetical protein EP343_22765 [Deltaproteobacteria bacterium]